MTFSGMKNALIFLCIFHEKWAPKWSQNRCQNRLVTILGGPRAARDPLWMFSGRKKTEKGCSKIDAKKMMRNLKQNKANLCDRRARFGAGGEVRRGQAPPGPAIPALIQLFSLTRPAPGGVRRTFSWKMAQRGSHGRFILLFERFLKGSKKG